MPAEAAAADGSAEITAVPVIYQVCAEENEPEIAAVKRNVTGAEKNAGKKEERKEKEEKLPVTVAAMMVVQDPAEIMKMPERHAAVMPEITEITVPWMPDIRGSKKAGG